jgi:hypothetical protein
MQYATNPPLELAFRYVTETSRNVFLTGKAGTGKTTFLSRIKAESSKNMIVVAPTGVAAINAGGMTIHSFFQLPFSPFVPGSQPAGGAQRKFQRDKIRLLQSLDLLVIDEISMVRADLLDAIDQVLRRYRDYLRPFGGLQLLLIGDLHQLAPIVKDDEWALLRDHYEAPWFFNSQALRQSEYLTIELTHIFRQSDDYFVGLLNRLRQGHIDESLLQALNSRYDPAFSPGHDHYITLCSHNATARQLNQQALAALPEASLRFSAKITGDFPEHAYPAELELELKEGAQVMFIKNDSGSERRFYNGRIGVVTRMAPGLVRVRCEGDKEDIVVEPAEWTNLRYQLDESSKQVRETVIGTFSQLPLRLAWAITIHKSQGLTFERVIIDARLSFAHGQVYVALSRCKTFEGIVLRSPLDASSVRLDSRIRQYGEEAQQPDEQQLLAAQRAYQQHKILQLFGFELLQQQLELLNRMLLEHERQFLPQAHSLLTALQLEAETRLLSVADKFGPQLQRYFMAQELPEQNEALQERLQKAAAWYLRELDEHVLPALYRLNLTTDNSKLGSRAEELFDRLRKELLIKRACFEHCSHDGFRLQAQLRLRRQQELDYKSMTEEAAATARTGGTAIDSADIPHQALYAHLRQWRSERAEEQQQDVYQVLSNRSMALLTQVLPSNIPNLLTISGIGPKKAEQYGHEILAIIRAYCEQHSLPSDLLPEASAKQRATKVPKDDTKAITLRLFLEQPGRSVHEMAEIRGLTPSTIYAHIAHFVGTGVLSAHNFIEAGKLHTIEQVLRQHPEESKKVVKELLGDDYDYGEIELVRAQLQWQAGGDKKSNN